MEEKKMEVKRPFEPFRVRVTTDYLNTRIKPSVDSELGSPVPVKKGTEFDVLDEVMTQRDEKWYKIKMDEKTAYINSEYVERIKE